VSEIAKKKRHDTKQKCKREKRRGHQKLLPPAGPGRDTRKNWAPKAGLKRLLKPNRREY
jgi:hypothetical protein